MPKLSYVALLFPTEQNLLTLGIICLTCVKGHAGTCSPELKTQRMKDQPVLKGADGSCRAELLD
jgi:hypothetical protein